MNGSEKIIPKHIAIIMDGNRRWAKERHLPIKMGHLEGVKALKSILKYIKKHDIGIEYLTVYAFSTENWNRSEEEVANLMDIFLKYINEIIEDDEGLRVKIIGDKSRLSDNLITQIGIMEEKTKNNKGCTLNVCINYSGRSDIIHAIKQIATKVKDDEINIDEIDYNLVNNNLYTEGIPYPDIVVRTSGEYRISDFLTWQIAYSEFMFFDKYWPDFSGKDVDSIIEEYSKRNRRFGK